MSSGSGQRDGNENSEQVQGFPSAKQFAWVCCCAERSCLQLQEGVMMNHAVSTLLPRNCFYLKRFWFIIM